jgi:hypothetical protein
VLGLSGNAHPATDACTDACSPFTSSPLISALQTLVSKGPQHAARGPLVLQGFQNPDAAVASAASNAAGAQNLDGLAPCAALSSAALPTLQQAANSMDHELLVWSCSAAGCCCYCCCCCCCWMVS